MSSLLNGSTQFWKETITNLNPCDCNRPELYIEREGAEHESAIVIPDVQSNSYFNLTAQIKINDKFNRQVCTNNNLPVEVALNNTTSSQSFANSNTNPNAEDEMFYENKRKWTEEEDAFLINYVQETGSRNWKKMTSFLPNKTPQQCAYRYDKLVKNMNKLKWSRNDDILLMELIDAYGQNWNMIVQHMPGRSIPEVQERFTKKLDPNLKRCKFDKEEDEMIIKFYEKYGNKWNEIAKYFKNRNASMIKNRYYSFIKKKTIKDSTISLSNKTLSESSSVYSMQPSSTPKNIASHTYNYNELQRTNSSVTNPPDTYLFLNQFKNVNINSQSSMSREGTVLGVADDRSVNGNCNGINDPLLIGELGLFNNYDGLLSNFDIETVEKSLCNYKTLINLDDFNHPEYLLNKTDQNGMDIDNEDDYHFPMIIPKQNSNSPKLKPLETDDTFKEHCKNIFINQKNSFSSDEPEVLNSHNHVLTHDSQRRSTNNTNNSFNTNVKSVFLNSEENEKLMKQFNLLENVFEKVYSLSNVYTQVNDISKVSKFYC